MIIAKGGAHSLFILSKGQTFRRYSGSPLEARFTLEVSVHSGRLRRPGDAVPTAGAKGDVGHLRFPMSPLDTPLTFHWPLSEAFAAKRGYGGSVPCVVSLMGRCKALSLLCVVCRA